jgi:hypothetical protein
MQRARRSDPRDPTSSPAVAALWLLVATSIANAQDADTDTRRLSFRVLPGAATGAAVIDRGAVDRIEVGDLVQILPRSGERVRGRVVRVDARTSLVELERRDVRPDPGAAGEMFVPMARYGSPSDTDPIRVPDRVPDESGEPGAEPAAGPEDDPRPPQRPEGMPPVRWSNEDRTFRSGQPLLAQATRPEERPSRVTGRAYTIGEFTRNSESDFQQSFARLGIGVDVDNPFGQGGRFESLIETNYRREFDEDEGANLLVRRLSYTWGGTRFDRDRVQIGRFLQYGFPEFSTIDGIQYSRRLLENHEAGASVGFLPVPDNNFNGYDDFQTSLWYLFRSDEYESTTLGVGYQYVMHEGKTDRNLVVLKGDSRPTDDWLLSARLHLDFEDANDQFRNDPVLVSQVVAQATRTFENGDFFRIGYRRLAFPEIQRQEFLPPPVFELANDHYDRIFTEGSHLTGESTRWHGYAALFTDEDFTGGAGEVGVDLIDATSSDSNLDVTGFATYANYATVLGGRVRWTQRVANGSYNAFYELSHNNERQFVPEVAVVIQHRLRVSRTFYTVSGWDADIYGETQLIGQDFAYAIGLFVQRRF